MRTPSAIPRLTDIVEAITHVRAETAGLSLDAFEADWRKRWLVERGIEIIGSQPTSARRGKARHPEIPWRQVADIGNILRHEYQRVAPDVLWRVVQDDLVPLERVCRAELTAGSAP